MQMLDLDYLVHSSRMLDSYQLRVLYLHMAIAQIPPWKSLLPILKMSVMQLYYGQQGRKGTVFLEIYITFEQFGRPWGFIVFFLRSNRVQSLQKQSEGILKVYGFFRVFGSIN